ncbi:hypothetical protein COX93_02510 [Candidatus Nomurabacteria bacterium CG_4_10_14_0_2_um_filter_30_12]|uniref:Uncharacterized protein n=2 Tax=Candidatus Nomuraibacteriota TaxID=1752729 RepID=A0A1J4UYE5_9BACT|nr:MAG: hypothetical protein AUJ22_00585 [Candidatus Nomurabacteria bacterium CG1_02_31_12]PIZ86991.1 MAG: hypothetical protein COX93_02510 [Candidatus Nomurabacteria bacterium CG_4_10_14_0_2_um_filter_30_12]
MINQQLINFIRQQLHVGSTKNKITKDLLSGDWNEQDIEEGFNAIVDIPIPKTLAPESIINPTFSNNLDQNEFHTQILNQPTTPFPVVLQKVEPKLNTIIETEIKKEPISTPPVVAKIEEKEAIVPQDEIIVSNQLENQTSIPVLKETLNLDSNLDLKLTPTPTQIPTNSNIGSSGSDSIATINQKLNPSLHFHSNAIPDLDFSKDSSVVAENSTNVLEKSNTKNHFNKKILFIVLIVFLLILGLILIYYFRDSLEDLPIFNYFL